jgi:hypothetical protein
MKMTSDNNKNKNIITAITNSTEQFPSDTDGRLGDQEIPRPL